MFRITLMAAAVALSGATAVAQGPMDGVGGATSRGGGSTGPTFPAPGPETLIATGPAPTDVDVRPQGQPAPGGPTVDLDSSSQVASLLSGLER